MRYNFDESYDVAITKLLDSAQRVTKADACILSVVQEDCYLFRVCTGVMSSMKFHKLEAAKSLVGKSAELDRAMITGDAMVDPATDQTLSFKCNVRSIATHPVKLGGNIIGVVAVYARRQDAFSEITLNHLANMARLLGTALSEIGCIDLEQRVVQHVKNHMDEMFVQNNFLEAIVNSAPVQLFAYDCIEQSSIYTSPATLALFGYDVEEFQALGKEINNVLIHPDDQVLIQQHQGALRSLKSGESVDVQYRALWPDGSHRWLLSRSSPYEFDPEGKCIKVAGVTIDVHQLVLTQQALRAHNEMLRVFAEHCPIPVAILDRTLRYMTYSRAWSNSITIKNEDNSLVGLTLESTCFIDASRQALLKRAMAGEVITGASEAFFDVHGNIVTSTYEIRPWHRYDGEIGGIIIYSNRGD